MRVYRLRGRRLHIGLDGNDKIIGIGNPIEVDRDAGWIERFGIAPLGIRQHLRDGVLYLDGKGLCTLIEHIIRHTARPSGRRLHRTICSYIAGEAEFRPVLRATLRAMWGVTHAPGSAQLYLDDARAAMAEPNALEANLSVH